MSTNQNYFTPSDKKQIFEIFSEINYKLKQLGSIHTGGMTLFFNDKSKEPKWHISIGSDNDGYTLIYSEFSDKENKWIRKDEQTCEYFNDALSILKLYRKKLDDLGFEKALPQKAIYLKYAIYDRSNSSYVNWYLTKTNKFNYFYCPQGSDYYEMRKLFLNSLVLFDTAEEAKEYVYQNKKDIISKNTVDIIQIKIEDESHYHFGRKSIIHIKNYNEDINEYDMEIDGIDLYYNNNIIGQLGTTKDHNYNGEVALVSNLNKRFIQSVMHYLYSTLRGIKWEKPTILSSPIEDKYFGYNPSDIYTDDIDVVYGSKTIGYCGTKNSNFTGEIRFKDGVDENLKKAVLYKFNNSSLYNDVEWKEVEKMKESIESKLAENFANELKNLQREGLFENVKSFDLDFTGKGINIKLNESINSHDTPFLFFLKTKQYLCEEFFKQLYGVDNNSIVTNFQKEVIKKCNISVNKFKSNTLWGIYFSHLTPFIKDEDIFRIIEDHNGESLLQKEFGSVEALKECMNRIDLLRPDSQAFERMKKFFSLFISDVEDWKNKIWNKTWSENLNLLSGYILGNISWEVLDDKINRSSKSSESSKTSTTPFMDEIFSLAQNIYIFDEIIDKWPDSYDYYSEVAESVGDDYDDIKDRFDFDQLNLRDCIEFITEHDGENIAKKMFGTIENIQKSFEEYDSNEDVKNVLTQFVDYFRDDLNEYEEQYWRECIDSAVSDWNAYYSDDDNDY